MEQMKPLSFARRAYYQRRNFPMPNNHSRLLLLLIALVLLLSACSVNISPGGNSTSPTATTGTSNVQAHGNTAPDSGTFDGCPARGDGGDPQLNLLKNRTDTATWSPISFSEMISWTWPHSVEKHDMASWSQSDANAVAQHNGTPVSLTGYVALARREGPESPNCHLQVDRDFHIWIVDHSTTDRSHSIITEATPRVRAHHSGWAIDNFFKISRNKLQVRMSGWSMLDQEHPEQLNQTRGTLWEIHPIMQIEVQQNGSWVPLDSAQL